MSKAVKKEGGASRKRKGAPSPAADVCDDPLLSCPVCLEPFMDKVYQCHGGHPLCHKCTGKVNDKCPSCSCSMMVTTPTGPKFIRCIIVEQLAQKAPTSCGQGECKFVGPRESIVAHRKTCDHRPFFCPLYFCKWEGQTRDEFVAHLHDKHVVKDVTLEKGKSYTTRLNNPNRHIDVTWVYHIISGSESFILMTKNEEDYRLETVLMSVGFSMPCRWMLQMGRRTKYFSCVSDHVCGIRDKSFDDAMYRDVRLEVPSTVVLGICDPPLPDVTGDERPFIADVNGLRLTLTIY